jgi:hypothetical protein
MHDSAWGRLIGVFVSPSRTFASIAARPTWAPAFILLWVLGSGSSILAWQKVDPGEVREATREQLAARPGMSEEQREQALDQAAKFTPIMGTGCSVVMPPIAYLIAALLFWVALKIAGGAINFPTSFAVTLHGMMPWAIAALLAVPIVLAAETIGYRDLQGGNLLASSAAAFAPEDASQVVRALLGSLDVFSFWTVALLAVGFAIAAKVSRGKAAVAVVVLWLVWVVVKVALAAVGDAFGGGG